MPEVPAPAEAAAPRTAEAPPAPPSTEGADAQQAAEAREREAKRFITPARAHILAAVALNDPAMLHPESRTNKTEEELAAGLEDHERGVDYSPLAGLSGESRIEHYKEKEGEFDQQRTEWVTNTQAWIDWAATGDNRPGFREAMMALGITDMTTAANTFYEKFLDSVKEDGQDLTGEKVLNNIQTGLQDFATKVIGACDTMEQVTDMLHTLEPMLGTFGTHLGADKRLADYIVSEAFLADPDQKEVAKQLLGKLDVGNDKDTYDSLEALADHAEVDPRIEQSAPEYPGTSLQIGDIEVKIRENTRFEGATTQEVARVPIENGEYHFTVDLGTITRADADAIVIPSNAGFILGRGPSRSESQLANDIDQIANTTTPGDPNAASAKFFDRTNDYVEEHGVEVPAREGEGTVKLIPFGDAVAFENDQMKTRNINNIIMLNSLPYSEGEKVDAEKIREMVVNALVAAADKGLTSVAFPNIAAERAENGEFGSVHETWAPILSGFLTYIERAQKGEVPASIKKLSLVEYGPAIDQAAKRVGEELTATLDSIPRIPKQPGEGATPPAAPAAPELQPPVDVAPINNGDKFHFGEDKEITIVGRVSQDEGADFIYMDSTDPTGMPGRITEAELRTYGRVMETPPDETTGGGTSLDSTASLEGTPAEFTRDNLDAVFADPEYSSDKLLKFLKGRYKEQYEAPSGVWEGYTLEQHTKMMMDLYEKYFANQDLPMDKNLFRLTLALHDIGKPQAASEGDRGNQHEVTREIMDQALTDLGYGEEQRKLAIAVVDNDFLGAIVDNRADFAETVEAIKQRAGEAGMDPQEFFDLVRVYYTVDSGSYTVGAGGQESLDENFRFTDGNLTFVPEIEEVFTRMRTGLVDDSVDKTNVDICPPLTPNELAFGLQYLGEVFSPDDGAAQRSGFENSSMARHYVRELQDIFRDYGEQRVLPYAERSVKHLQDTLEELGIDGSSLSKSTAWYLQDMAQERYLAQRPNIDNKDHFDPLLQLSVRRIDEDAREKSREAHGNVFNTRLGREIYNQPDREQITTKLSDSMDANERQELEGLLQQDLTGDSVSDSDSLRRIGDLVYRNLPQMVYFPEPDPEPAHRP